MADEATIAKAREMGWIPRDRFDGDQKDFVDADEFVSRGEKLLPILKANNRKLNTTVRNLSGQVQALGTQLTEAQRQIAEFSKMNLQSNVERLEQRKRQLVAAKVAARQADDAQGEVDVEQQISTLDGEIGEAKKALGTANQAKPPVKTNGSQSPQADPAYQAFLAENPWYGTDKAKTRYANGVAADLRASDPNSETLIGEAFYTKVVEEVQSQFRTQRSTSKVEGGGNGSGNGGGDGGGSGKSYSDLPPDAKQACDRQAKNTRMVGEGKQFKDANAYREHYVQTYFADEV